MCGREIITRPVGATIAAVWMLTAFTGETRAGDLDQRVAERMAVERVYASHRTGATQPFEKTLPTARIEQLIRDDAKKEATLRRVYKVTITSALVDAEVKRIDSTTRAPEMLGEIKKALGNDPARFVQTVVRPIIVERELRARFDNDDKIHAPERLLATRARETALVARKDGVERQTAALTETKSATVNDVVWRLTPRPANAHPASAVDPQTGLPTMPTSAKTASNSFSIGAAAQATQPLPPTKGPNHDLAEGKFYFEDLPLDLQRVLGAQLHQSGDVSAVIETPAGFLVFLAKEKTAETLRVASFSIHKRNYEEWLAQQPEEK